MIIYLNMNYLQEERQGKQETLRNQIKQAVTQSSSNGPKEHEELRMIKHESFRLEIWVSESEGIPFASI